MSYKMIHTIRRLMCDKFSVLCTLEELNEREELRMKVNYLEVKTVDGREYIYSGTDAYNVHSAINKAGARGAEWTTPTILENRSEVVFIVRNITQFRYTKEDSE
jgi:hypothetical protein